MRAQLLRSLLLLAVTAFTCCSGMVQHGPTPASSPGSSYSSCASLAAARPARTRSLSRTPSTRENMSLLPSLENNSMKMYQFVPVHHRRINVASSPTLKLREPQQHRQHQQPDVWESSPHPRRRASRPDSAYRTHDVDMVRLQTSLYPEIDFS
jgi:hypothetical protein